MKIKLAITAMAAVLSLTALSASASADGPINWAKGLQLTENGTPVARGAAVFNDQLILSGCEVQSTATLLNNGDPIDLLRAGTPTYIHCEAGTISGSLQLLDLQDNGTAILSPNVTLTTPAGCVYYYPLLVGSFQASEGVANISGEGTGYRVRPTGRTSCAATITNPFEVGEIGSVDDALLSTELISNPTF
jgi:hypothetical protein